MTVQCRFFGGKAKPEENAKCARPGSRREYDLELCDLHYYAIHDDAEDWSFEVIRDMTKDDYFILTHANGDQYDGRRCVYLPEMDRSTPWRVIKNTKGKEYPPALMGCLLHHGPKENE